METLEPGDPAPEILYWVGCAASFDERARATARATASLLLKAGLDVAICGDVAHSRVARSNLGLLSKMGARVRLCGPRTLLPMEVERFGARVVASPGSPLSRA